MTIVYGYGMSSPQDSPTRKKQKVRATRKLALWREKQEALKAAAPAAAAPAAAATASKKK
jgi:hypothetical protein